MSLISTAYILVIGGITFIFHLLPRRFQLPFVSAAAALLLLLNAPGSFSVLCLLILSSYWLGNRPNPDGTIIWSMIGVISFMFFVYRWHLTTLAPPEHQVWLLLGAAFYVLRTIHYLIEKFKGTLPPHSFTDYLFYQLFLPIICIGPIHRFPRFLRESRRRRWDQHLFSKGLERILYGYAKVVIIAEFGINMMLHTYVATIPVSHQWYLGYLSCLEYGFYLYFSFAGFSDIAIGFSLLLGIRIEENFRNPFLAPNISHFWKCWHITLSRWCRDYIYLPITAVSHRPLLGIISSMLILGIWHEWSLRYLLWGLYHGIGVGSYHIYQSIKPNYFTSSSTVLNRIYHFASIALTFHFVVFSFQITKSEDIILSIINVSKAVWLLAMGI